MTAGDNCLCNRCNFMVNVLCLPFAPSVAVYRKICAFSKLNKRGLTSPSVNCRLFA